MTGAISAPRAPAVADQIDAGHQLSRAGQLVEAEVCYRRAIELDPTNALAHSNLGWVRQMQDDDQEAIACYRTALRLDPDLRIARRNLASRLVELGRRDESLPLWHAELATGADGATGAGGLAWIQSLISQALDAHDLRLAGDYAAVLAQLRWGSDWHPPLPPDSPLPLPVGRPEVFLTVPKLLHDVEQLGYLQEQGVLGDEFTPVVDEYRRLIERLTAAGEPGAVPLDADARDAIGHVYNRLVHVRDTPRVRRALSETWNPAEVETQYLDTPPGVVVVDDFLSAEALDGVRRFSLESTVWFANRYAHGRLGAFFRDGFNCPLLLQIAEELRDALPRVIGDRYPLRQLWGFKNAPTLPADSVTHADFAAVNVNFWVTPEDANLDPASGGLVVYAVDAPLSWDFYTYNGRVDVINAFLQRQQARSITIPYRQNRAIIFNSDLFHGTAAVHFRPGYENRRINITMLYGDRADEVHHRQLSGPEAVSAATGSAPWRSAAFSRARSGRR